MRDSSERERHSACAFPSSSFECAVIVAHALADSERSSLVGSPADSCAIKRSSEDRGPRISNGAVMNNARRSRRQTMRD
jgi:hypothetical protein